MSIDPQHLAHLKTLYPDAEVMPEGGINHIYFPALPIETNGTVLKMKALLRLGEHEGYATRLFVERQITDKGQNWKCFQLLGTTYGGRLPGTTSRSTCRSLRSSPTI